MKAFGVLATLALALALQTTLVRFLPAYATNLDLVLVVVVCIGLKSGPVTGMLAGSVAGIIQDAISIGVIGIGGLAKSVVGFAVGTTGQQLLVTAALPRLMIFLGASIGHGVLFNLLYMLLGLESFSSLWSGVLSQALVNTAVGMLLFSVVEAFPVFVERRRWLTRMRH